MESSGDAGDDHGSGWLQVKKKHRSSSKFSLQGWVGGFSGKHGSGVWHSRPPSNLKFEKSRSKGDEQPSTANKSFAVNVSGGTAYSASATGTDEIGVGYLDKCVVSQDTECTSSPSLATIVPAYGDSRIIEEKEYSRETDLDVLPNINNCVIPKIKWGDLDDGALILDCEKNLGGEINTCSIRSSYSNYRRVEHGDALVANSLSFESRGGVSLAASVNEGKAIPTSQENKTSNGMKDLPYEDIKIDITNQEIKSLDDVVSSAQETSLKLINATEDSTKSFIILSNENAATETLSETRVMVEFPPPVLLGEAESSKASQVPVVDKVFSTVVTTAEPEQSTFPGPVEGNGGQKADIVLDDLPKAQIISTIAAGDKGESKERFRQRLWCFLFENLNRAVDELYLLCELECDVEQMKEAILVLEEAASDFKELNTRVEKFEKVKKNSSQTADGVPLTMKSDHRRPHALSWEVRRMTSSPHRAEILSSSLEAFTKIQQERASAYTADVGGNLAMDSSGSLCGSNNCVEDHISRSDDIKIAMDSLLEPARQTGGPQLAFAKNLVRSGHLSQQSQSVSVTNTARPPSKESLAASVIGKGKREVLAATSEVEKQNPRKDKMSTDSVVGKIFGHVDHQQGQATFSEKDREKRNGTSRESMNAWKEKRNWEDILSSPIRVSSRFSHSPGLGRKSTERARVLHDKLMSPEKKKKTLLDLKKEAEEKHARAMRIRTELENERVQKLQRTSEKVNRVNEWQAVRSMKLRELMYARHQRSESRHEAFLAQVVRRAGDESSKVNEVRFITSLNEENKKLILRQKLQDSELRRAEKLQIMRSKQREDMAREEAVLGRKKLIEAEKLQRLAETQRKKEEAQVRREEERKASSAAREAKAMEQMRRKEERAKAQQEEAELLAQKLAEKLSESEQRRKFYLEQIRERASMDFRDQSSPLLRRSINKDISFKSAPLNNNEDSHSTKNMSLYGKSNIPSGSVALQHSLKRRIKKIRQRLMSLKFEFSEASVATENVGIGYRTAVVTARAKMGRWLQELQRLRQERKAGVSSIGLIISEIIKFMEGKDPELQASRQAGLLDFIASAVPASHTSKLESCQVTVHFLHFLKVVLSMPANKSYFLSQNLLPPIIPMLAAALENYIKIAASSNGPGSTNLSSTKTSNENLEPVSEVLDGFLWIVATIIGHTSCDERQLQMQDGLLELVIAYQIIHHLRDLFALYDRPQVEGSPFPSSIILSIKLLAVLTSKFRTMSSIEWESFPVEMMRNERQVTRSSDNENSGCSPSCNSSRGHGLSFPASNDTGIIVLPNVPEDQPPNEPQKAPKKIDPLQGNSSNKVESINTEKDAVDNPNEPRIILTNDTAKCSALERDVEIGYKGGEINNINKSELKQPVKFLLSAMSETGLVCLPSLLTAVLLQANNRTSSEQGSYILPSNFEEVATGVLRVLNKLALIDITFIQRMLAKLDLKMEFFHLMSFLLSHCTSKWKVAYDQIGLLLLESLMLLGYFSLFHPENQAVLRWGKSPTILHKVCDLPFVFFSDPELMPALAGTLVAACYGCERNKAVVEQELSIDMIISLLRSCQNGMHVVNSSLAVENHPKEEPSDAPQRISRSNLRSTRAPYGKIGTPINSTRTAKTRNPKDGKATKVLEEMALKHDLPASEASNSLMLHSRFPASFLDKVEQFFSTDNTRLKEES